MSRAYRYLAPLLFALPLAGPACSQTPVIVPVRSMERPRDVDFLCLKALPDGRFQGAPLEKCHVDELSNPIEPDNYRLQAVVTQTSRGELAVVDLGRSPIDQDSVGMVKVDPRIPGYTFLPVGAVPSDVAADPAGKAVYVASGRDLRIDIIPAEMVRGPIDSEASSGGPRPWPHLDFAFDDGSPRRLAIVRELDDTGTLAGRLYVLLSDAKGGPKIAVYDITKTPLTPTKIGEITLTLTAATPLTVPPLDCSFDPDTAPGDPPRARKLPWWNDYDKCFGFTTPLPTPPTVPLTSDTMHLAGITVAGGMLYAADDAAPYVHVFDIRKLNGVEVQRIGIGSSVSRLAVSEPVPDETTLANEPALEICEMNGWFGDGKDHTADNAVVAQRLRGRCRAHRYLYAVDLDDATNGDGSIAVVDIPTTLARSTQKDGSTIVTDTADLAGATLATPMACDSPFLPTSRIALGNFGIGGQNGVPARAVTFVHNDSPSATPAALRGVRCRPWGKDGCDPADTTCVEYSAVDPLKASGTVEYFGINDPDPGNPVQTKDAIAARIEAAKGARRDAANSWRVGVDPKRLRGTFALVVLDNGAVVVVDVDDLDAPCRGPKTDAVVVPPFGSDTKPLGQATGEYMNRVTRRHHPRSTRFFDADNLPTVTGAVFSAAPNAVGSLATEEAPRLVPLDATGQPAETGQQLTPAPNNPYAMGTETWTITYEAALPGYGGTAGSFSADATLLLDPAGAFCRRGTQAEAATAVETHDFIQVLDDVCAVESCGATLNADCLGVFGAPTDLPAPSKARDLVIGIAADDHVTIAKHFEPTSGGAFVMKDGPHPRLKQCFPGLTRYVVRANAQWVVVGSNTGFLHRRKAGTGGTCVIDTSKPMINNGRFTEVASNKKLFGCSDVFRNPSWAFMLQGGTLPSQRDMKFSFGGRFAYIPLTIGGGSLPTTIKPVAFLRGGNELLNWRMFAVIDAIDRGLTVVSVNDFTNFKVVN